MEFCEICDNLLYLRAEESADTVQLTKYCKHCSFTKTMPPSTAALKITETLYSEDDLLYLQYNNKFLRFDPTLPRTSDPSLVCPNKECSGPRDKPQVIFVKYHPVHMKYLYCCDYCGTVWRREAE